MYSINGFYTSTIEKNIENFENDKIIEHLPTTFMLKNPPESARSYSTRWGNNPVGTGHARSRLGSDQAWSALHNNQDQWMTIDLGAAYQVVGVRIEGRKNSNLDYQYVKTVKIQYSLNGYDWGDIPGILGSNSWKPSIKLSQDLTFNNVKARYIKIKPLTWSDHVSMRAGVLVIPPQFTSGLILSVFNISQIKELPTGTPALQKIHNAPIDIRHTPAQGAVNFNTPPHNQYGVGNNSHRFSMRWVGLLKITENGEYYFKHWSDDGSKLWIRNQEVKVKKNGGGNITDPWIQQGRTAYWNTTAINLNAGYHPIRLEHYEWEGGRSITLEWKKGSGAWAVIPANRFYHKQNTSSYVVDNNQSLNIDPNNKLSFNRIGDDNDPYSLRKIRHSVDNNSLRLTINDNSDESLQIWGDSCGHGGCGGPGRKVHQFTANGDAWHRGNLAVEGSIINKGFALQHRGYDFKLGNHGLGSRGHSGASRAFVKDTAPHTLSVYDPPENKRTYLRVEGGHTPGNGHARSRLDGPAAWSAGTVATPANYMVMDLDKVYDVKGVVIRGRKDTNWSNQYITEFKVDYTDNTDTWPGHVQNGDSTIFKTEWTGNEKKERSKNFVFEKKDIKARYIKIILIPGKFNSHPALRAGVFVPGSTLVVNYGNDFKGGTRIDGDAEIKGNLRLRHNIYNKDNRRIIDGDASDWLRINNNNQIGRTALYGNLSINGTRNGHGGLSVGTWDSSTVGNGNIRATGKICINDTCLNETDIKRINKGSLSILRVNPPNNKRIYQRVASNHISGQGHAQSMINSMLGWAAGGGGEASMIIDLDTVMPVKGLIIKDRNDSNWSHQYIKKFKVAYSANNQTIGFPNPNWTSTANDDAKKKAIKDNFDSIRNQIATGGAWISIKDGIVAKIFETEWEGNAKNQNRSKEFEFVNTVQARYIKITISGAGGWYNSHPTLRAAVLVDNTSNDITSNDIIANDNTQSFTAEQIARLKTLANSLTHYNELKNQ